MPTSAFSPTWTRRPRSSHLLALSPDSALRSPEAGSAAVAEGNDLHVTPEERDPTTVGDDGDERSGR